MTMNFKSLAALALAAALAGCSMLPGNSSSSDTKSSDAKPDSKPAASAPAKSGPAPGMNANGEVIDSSKVEDESGTKVKGLNDTEGYLIGKPAKGSKFLKLKIGMGMKQVTDLVGQATDQGSYVTGKAWIPFNFGGDTHRYEMTYKGVGRLVFSNDSRFSSDMSLIRIIYNSNEPGYR